MKIPVIILGEKFQRVSYLTLDLKMLGFILIFSVCAICVKSQESEISIPDNKTLCMSDMIEWCDGMKYPQQGAGLAVLQVVYDDPNGFYRVFCSSDADGTNCTRNTSPWFGCSPDHILTYKGQVITNETSSKDIDDDICATVDKAFNELFIQNLSYDNTTLQEEVEKGIETFFDRITMMEEQIDMIKKMLEAIPYIGDFWNMLGDEFLAREFAMMPMVSDRNENKSGQMNDTTTDQMNETATNPMTEIATEQKNEIERE